MKNIFGYENKRVVVTGASSGMGQATALLLKELGAHVVAVDRQKPQHDFHEFIQIDLRDKRAIEDRTAEIFRSGPVNNLFYCAGLPGEKFPDFDVITVNYLSLRYMSELCAAKMGKGDAITNVSSGASLAYLGNMANVMTMLGFGTDYDKALEWLKPIRLKIPTWYEAYSFSKQCSVVWTMQAATHITMKRNVRVNVISPGPTETAMLSTFVENQKAGYFEQYPKPIEGRFSRPDEQAWPLIFLGSKLASYISGENLFTDGGTCAGMLSGVIDPTAMMGTEEQIAVRRAKAKELYPE